MTDAHIDIAALRPLRLADVKRDRAPVSANNSASAWDLGDGVLGFEIHTRRNVCDGAVVALLEAAPSLVQRDFRSLVIGSDDETAFSAGADGATFIAHLSRGDIEGLERFLRRGQDALLALRYVDFPVVAAACGLTLGGGLELMLHADAVVAHASTRFGFPERWIGAVPGWGGVAQTLARQQARDPDVEGAARATMALISQARILDGAEAAKGSGLLRPSDDIVERHDLLLAVAKLRAEALATDYAAPARRKIVAAGESFARVLEAGIPGLAAADRLADAEIRACHALAHVIVGGAAIRGAVLSEEEIMRLERTAFLELAQSTDMLERITALRATGRRPMI